MTRSIKYAKKWRSRVFSFFPKEPELTPQERDTAEKTARVMRAIRKKLDLTQKVVSKALGVSQGALSKVEHGILIPSAPQWVQFCRLTNIPVDSLMTGYIDSLAAVHLRTSIREGSFKIPKRYSINRGSKVRAMLPFVRYLSNTLGRKKTFEYFKSIKMDPDYFVDLNNQINLLFCLDLCKSLINKRLLKPQTIPQLVQPISNPEAHGMLHTKYDNAKDGLNRLVMLLKNSQFYECNFNYQIEEYTQQSLVFSVTPEKHLKDWDYRNDPDLGDFLCQYKRNYFGQFTLYNLQKGEKQVSIPQIHELECHYKGAPKCTYKIRAAS